MQTILDPYSQRVDRLHSNIIMDTFDLQLMKLHETAYDSKNEVDLIKSHLSLSTLYETVPLDDMILMH